jgi:hypothetical protein
LSRSLRPGEPRYFELIVPNLEEQVVAAIRRHPATRSIRLVGSRAEGRANPRSDWDFSVETTDFQQLAADLPLLLAPLDPIAQQWDRLSLRQCWMVMLHGPVKIDLIFPDHPHEPLPPWVATAENLQGIDAHFWDWILWLGSKEAAGKKELVADELQKLFGHLLAPLGASGPPATIEDAVESYRHLLVESERFLGATVPRLLGDEVGSALDGENE